MSAFSLATQIDFDKAFAGQRGATDNLRLFGLRGVDTPKDGNPYEQYNDRIFRLIGDEVTEYTASTEPSWALVQNPINSDGAARLCPGNHLFQVHLMHAGTPRAHLALGQAEDVHVDRLHTDGTVRQAAVPGQYGICIHSGGAGVDTDRFSAGCQILENEDGYFGDPFWTSFYAPIHSIMQTQTRVVYLLRTVQMLQDAGCM